MNHNPILSTPQRISIALLGDSLDAAQTERVLIQQLAAVRYRDAYLIRRSRGEVWLFDYGVLVGWDLDEDDRKQLCHSLADLIVAPLSRPLIEQYSYRLELEQPFRIHHDLLVLAQDDPLTRLGLSHAFAQSAKLGFYEEKAGGMIGANAYISRQLARVGKVALSRRQLAKLRGQLFETSSDITLHFNLLDTPEFFWDYPELEADYLTLARYLDLIPRVELLNKKLTTIHELLDMLAAEQYHKHSSFLEWIIIILIAVDIAIYFYPK